MVAQEAVRKLGIDSIRDAITKLPPGNGVCVESQKSKDFGPFGSVMITAIMTGPREVLCSEVADMANKLANDCLDKSRMSGGYRKDDPASEDLMVVISQA